MAGVDWTRTHLNHLLKQVDPQKIVMAVGQQGYDWTKGVAGAESLRYQTAVVTAKESYDGKGQDGLIRLDPASLNPTFTYSEDTLDTERPIAYAGTYCLDAGRGERLQSVADCPPA